MLVRYYVDVDRSLEEVERKLDVSRGDLGAWAAAAYREGEQVRARIGFGPGPLSKTVEMIIGDPMHGTETVTYPIVWRASGPVGLFPSMDAELVLAAMGPDRTHITFQGRYEPPLEAVGKLIDRAAMHRVAESTVRHLVERLAASLENGLPGEPPGAVS
ncbi:MAG: hypothetical protein R6X29_11650 [Acidimicrobiia bacterium]